MTPQGLKWPLTVPSSPGGRPGQFLDLYFVLVSYLQKLDLVRDPALEMHTRLKSEVQRFLTQHYHSWLLGYRYRGDRRASEALTFFGFLHSCSRVFLWSGRLGHITGLILKREDIDGWNEWQGEQAQYVFPSILRQELKEWISSLGSATARRSTCGKRLVSLVLGVLSIYAGVGARDYFQWSTLWTRCNNDMLLRRSPGGKEAWQLSGLV